MDDQIQTTSDKQKDQGEAVPSSQVSRMRSMPNWLLALFPLALLIGLIVVFVYINPLGFLPDHFLLWSS